MQPKTSGPTNEADAQCYIRDVLERRGWVARVETFAEAGIMQDAGLRVLFTNGQRFNVTISAGR